MSKPTFSDLALAAYCPRKLYYRRQEPDRTPPPDVEPVRDLAFRYPDLLDPGGSDRLRDAPIDVTPTQFRANLERARARFDAWTGLANPTGREVYLEGRECRGVAHKVLASPLVPSIVSPGRPPPEGTWRPQAVKAVAAAKALAWERNAEIPRAVVEYPAHGVVRTVRLTTRNRSAYRRTLWTIRSMRGVPSRIRDESKCDACEYRTTCGTKTRSLKTLLGLG